MFKLSLFFCVLVTLGCKPTPDGMVYIPASEYLRGNQRPLGTTAQYPEESPAHLVTVDGFFIDTHEVTNSDFLTFVRSTGYQTQAEQGTPSALFPQAPKEQLQPGALVFTPPSLSLKLWNPGAEQQWWTFVPGASWQHPEGPDSTIENRMNHPVTCVTNADARAYASWAGKRLPTEAEWEAAARGGLKGALFTWGDTPLPKGQWMANTYQGTFPTAPKDLDGYLGTAPVGSYPSNNYGLYDMSGNVWEHVSDFYRPDTYETLRSPCDNPTGPEAPIDHFLYDKLMQGAVIPTNYSPPNSLCFLYTCKGGSYLCHHTYCLRYRPAARYYSEGLSPTNHCGFRCAKSNLKIKNE